MSSSIGKTWEQLAATAPIGPLDPAFRPILVAGVSWVWEGGKLVAIDLVNRPAGDSSGLDPNLLAADVTIALDDQRRESLSRIHSLLDGAHTISEIAAASDWNRDECSRFIQGLYEQAVVRDAAARPTPALSFYHHVVTLGRREMLRQLEGSPMVHHMLQGTLNKRLVIGYLVEEYHLVASAASHISPVIATTPNQRLRMMFSDYLSGEYWHCLLLKKGLLAAGITEDELAAADPLAGTLAAINLQRNLARTDVLAYSVCLSINEGGDVRAAAAFSQLYDRIGTFVPPDALAPSREHAELDFQDEHDALGAEAFVEEVALSGARQDAIARAVMARVHTQVEQHREMAAYYSAAEGPLVHSYLATTARSVALG